MRKQILLLSALCFALFSCSTPRLFEGEERPPKDFSVYTLMVPEPCYLRAGDKITVSIWGHDELSIGSINTPYMTFEGTGRWIKLDQAGEVNLPKIGRVKLGGFNTKEAAYQLEQLYAQHIVNPVINVRILNHFVTILGEVNKPGKYRIDDEKLRLLALIGEAEGFTPYAHFEDVNIVRQVGKETYNFSVDLTTLSNIESHNVYLKPDDIIYVPPKGIKQKDRSIDRAIGIASIVTSVALILSIFKK